MKTIANLPIDEYKEGAAKSLWNARQHLEVSKICAEKSLWGFAMAHMVLGCEELCKAAVMQIKVLIPNAMIGNIVQYFSRHDVKHKTVKEIFSAIFDVASGAEGSNQDIDLANLKGEDLKTVISMIAIVLLGSLDKSEINEMTLEEIRQKGLYVSWEDKWFVPNESFTKNIFEEQELQFHWLFETIEEGLFSGQLDKGQLKELAIKLGYLKHKA